MVPETHNPMSPRIISLLPFLLLPAASQAAVSIFAEYHLGETGSLATTANLPQDSSGNGLNFGNALGGGSTVGSSVLSPAAGIGGVAGTSTAYLDTSDTGNQGWYSDNLFTMLPTDNYAFGVFAKAVTQSGNDGWVFGLDGGNGALSIEFIGSGWRASRRDQAWIGDTATFTSGQWVHLAVIRQSGVTGFYANGTLVGATDSGTPGVAGTPHLGVSPGAGYYFDGYLDEARVVTFSGTDSTASIISALQVGLAPVPEPSTYGLTGSVALGLAGAWRRRKIRS